MFSGVFRYDGYSSLLGKNRWGFFPGVSGGWVFTKEDFVKESLPFLYYGKLRASYGLNGNASGIGPYTLQGSYNSNKYHGNNGFLIGTLPNPSLRWEKTASFDIGLNVGLLGGRLNLDIDYYNRLTSDKYADFTLPSTTGFSSVKNNNGKLRNSGIELQLSGKVLDVNDFTWDASFNITYNKNKIIALPDNGQVRNRQNGQQVYTGRKVVNPGTGKLEDEKVYVGGFQEGMEYGILVGYQAEGIYRSVDDIPGNFGALVFDPKRIAAAAQCGKVDRSGRERRNGGLSVPDDLSGGSDGPYANLTRILLTHADREFILYGIRIEIHFAGIVAGHNLK